MEPDDELLPRVVDLLKQVYPFRILKDDVLQDIALAGVIAKFGLNESIYLPGDRSEYLYLIIEGEVNLNHPTPAFDVSFGLLEPGDFFGVETADKNPVCLLEAFTISQGLMFCLERETLLALLVEFPTLNLAFDMLLASLKLSLQVPLPWRNPEETLHYIAQRHPIFLLLRLFFPVALFAGSFTILTYLAFTNQPGNLLPGLIFGIVALFSGLWGIWNFLDWENDYAIVTNKRVIFQEKVIMLYDSRLEAPVEAVLSNKIESSQTGRIVGYGDLIMKTYTGTIGFPSIRHPEIVIGFVEDRSKRLMALRTEEELQILRERIRMRLGFKPTPRPQPRKQQAENAPLSFREWLGTIFRMRWESSGTITYRKHWLILVGDILLPALFMLALIVLFAMTLFGEITVLSGPTLLALEVVAGLIVAFWLWYQYADWANDIYIVNDDMVIDVYKKPLGYEEKRSAEVRNIQSVEYDQNNFAHLVFNFGDVRIRIGDTQFDFENVTNPSEVQSDLFRRIDKRKYAEKKKQDEELHRHLVDLADSYHKVMGDPYGESDKNEK